MTTLRVESFFFCNLILISVESCKFLPDTNYHGILADCCHLGLTTVPTVFPDNITSIILSHNELTVLKNYSFKHTPHLKFLDVSRNSLTRLESLAFLNCRKLEHLDLSSNQLAEDNVSYPAQVFDWLTNLRWLGLHKNILSMDDIYPSAIFKHLISLQFLFMDINTQGVLGKGMEALKNLRELRLFGETTVLRNDTFIHLRDVRLDVLDLTPVILDSLHNRTFSSLKQLKELYIKLCKDGLKAVLKSLSSFAGQSMRTLQINSVVFKEYDSRVIYDSTIEADAVKLVADICIDRLILSNNRILYIDVKALLHSPVAACLTYLDVSRNRFVMGGFSFILLPFSLPHLRYLDVAYQERVSPQFLSQPKLETKFKRTEQDSNLSKTPFGTITNVMETASDHKRIEAGGLICSHSKTVFVAIPKNLTYVNMSAITDSFRDIKTPIHFLNGDNLVLLNLSFIGLRAVKSQIKGVPNLVSLDISGNSDLNLCTTFFEAVPLVEQLYLNHFSLKQTVLTSHGRKYLKDLPQLKYLHLRNNRLWQLPSDIFQNNPMLEYIDLSENIFQTFPFDISLSARLDVVDLRSNSLGFIDDTSREKINEHMKQVPGNFSLMLEGNILACGCDNFDFLVWLCRIRVDLQNDVNVSCLLGDGHLSTTEVVFNNMSQLWKGCIGMPLFYITLTFVTALFASILFVLLIKTNYTVLVHKAINLLRKQVVMPKMDDYEIHVYLAYADHDHIWPCLCLGPLLEDSHLKVYMWDRDSVPGDSIADQIADNMGRSWKIIIYFTEAFSRDPWGYFNTMVAIRGIDNMHPHRVILLLPEWEQPHIPKCLLDAIPQSCMLQIPEDVMSNIAFWEKLVELVRS